MAITHQNTTFQSGNTAGGSNDITFAHDSGSGSNRLLLVGVGWDGSTTVTGVTYNSVSMTKLDGGASGNVKCDVYGLLAPATGSNTVDVDFSANQSSVGVTAMTLNGVQQVLPSNTNKSTGSGTALSTSITTTYTNSWGVDFWSKASAFGSVTVDGSQTERSNNSTKGSSTESKATVGSLSMDWTATSSSAYSHVVIEAVSIDDVYSLEQEGFRFRDDDGNETGASWLAVQDTNITRAKQTTTRLRVLVNATNDPGGIQYQLEYREKGVGDTWRAV